MPRQCAVCVHPERDRIDRAILAGESRASISRRWGLPPDSTERHTKVGHVVRHEQIMAAKNLLALHSASEDIVEKLQELITIAQDILARSIAANQFGAAMAGVRELARIFELIARLTGQLDEGTRVNVLVQQQQASDAEQELMLERLTVAERLELRWLIAKAQGEPEEPHVAASVEANQIVGVDVDGTAESFPRND